MKRKWEVRFSGTGGQGIIRSAVILAQAALNDGFDATQSQSYGPESRGGSTKGEVVIDDKIIYYPKVSKPNLLICLSKESYFKYADDIQAGGILIYDGEICRSRTKTVTIPEDVTIYDFPITRLAREEIKNELSANVLTLGILVGLTGLVTYDAMIEALKVNFKPKIIGINTQAFELGLKIAQEAIALDSHKKQA